MPRYHAVLRLETESTNTTTGIVFNTDTIIRVDDGVIELSELLNYDPDSAPLRNNLGILLWEHDKADEAIEQFDKAIELNPKYSFAYFNEAIVLRKRGRLREAGERMEKAVRLRPALTQKAEREP